MTECWASTIRAIDELECARTPQTAWEALSSTAAAYGFLYLAAFQLDREDAAPALLHANLPPALVEAFRRAGFAGIPARVRAVRHAVAASELRKANLTPPQRQLLADAQRTLDVGEALLVCVDAGDAKGFVVLAGSEPVMTPIIRSSLHLLAQLAFARTVALASTPPRREPGLLSPREAECLRLSAHGNTDVKIGRTLGISPRTARFHVENAKKKLGVATRVQAVAEALRRKAIAA